MDLSLTEAPMALSRSALRGIDPRSIMALLQRRGWAEKRRNDRWASWTSPTFGVIDVPLISDVVDYSDRVTEIVVDLAHRLSIDEAAVINALEEATCDTLRLRDARESTWAATTLSEGRRLLDVAHHSWAAGAAAAAKGKGDRPKTVLDSLRLGQTERGSYVVRVMAPVEPLSEGRQIAIKGQAGLPFTRRASTRLVSIVRATAKVAEDLGDVDDEKSVTGAAHELRRAGGTSALCMAIAEAAGNDPGADALEMRMGWAGTLPSHGADASVTFRAEVGHALRALSSKLRTIEPVKATGIVGFVVKLSKPQGANQGHATIATRLRGPAKEVRVVVTLDSAADYDQAIEAHRRGLPIQIVGAIKTHGKVASIPIVESVRLGLQLDLPSP